MVSVFIADIGLDYIPLGFNLGVLFSTMWVTQGSNLPASLCLAKLSTMQPKQTTPPDYAMIYLLIAYLITVIMAIVFVYDLFTTMSQIKGTPVRAILQPYGFI